MKLDFYFQVHQPYRLKEYTIFDIRENHEYFDTKKNVEIIKKVSNKCYLPMNNLLIQLLDKYPEFKVTFSFSGVVLEQFEKYAPETLESFKRLVSHKNVEILGETYYHSLSYIYSHKEFKEQIEEHKKIINRIFNKEPKVFRNTELIYENGLSTLVKELGFKGVITEGADHILGWKSPNYLYASKDSKLPLLLKNYRLSDDIAFRFSDRNWKEWPLSVEKFINWINNDQGNFINLFMDYETFGEHQWKETGIFDFMKELPKQALKNNHSFITPNEAIEQFKPVDEINVPFLISWADIERDLSAWKGNKIQESALSIIYSFEEKIKETRNKKLIEDWKKLQISDHFYYMSTKYFADGDVHKYFNPYESPYEAFIYYMNCIQDIKQRIIEIKQNRIKDQRKKRTISTIRKKEPLQTPKIEVKTLKT